MRGNATEKRQREKTSVSVMKRVLIFGRRWMSPTFYTFFFSHFRKSIASITLSEVFLRHARIFQKKKKEGNERNLPRHNEINKKANRFE